MYTSIRRHVYQLLDPASRQTRAERVGNALIALLVLSNVAAVILESVPSIQARAGSFFDRFEQVSVIVFAVEYALRVWTSVEHSRYRGAIRGRLRYIVSPMALVDLAVVVPGLMPTVTLDLRFIRIVRLIRMLRVLKFARYSRTLRTFASVFGAKQPEMAVIGVFLGVLIVLASSFMYIVENDAQPAAFSSIPAAMWWSVVTLTTVGYGDVYPVTPLGKLLGAFIALIGIGFFALPAGILSSAFVDEIQRARAKRTPKHCPHCQKALE